MMIIIIIIISSLLTYECYNNRMETTGWEFYMAVLQTHSLTFYYLYVPKVFIYSIIGDF